MTTPHSGLTFNWTVKAEYLFYDLGNNTVNVAVIPGSGGIRKVRFGFGGRGKSGGARIIYLFSGESLPVFILAAFAKSEKANLSAAERNALAGMVNEMIESYRRQE